MTEFQIIHVPTKTFCQSTKGVFGEVPTKYSKAKAEIIVQNIRRLRRTLDINKRGRWISHKITPGSDGIEIIPA